MTFSVESLLKNAQSNLSSFTCQFFGISITLPLRFYIEFVGNIVPQVFDLSSLTYGRNPVNQGLYDRLPNYILQQRHFYPLFPGRAEARVALQESGLGEFVGGTPDILILPSELQYFAKALPPILILSLASQVLSALSISSVFGHLG